MRYYELLEAMPQPGCPICRLILHNRDRYMRAILYEYITDPEVQYAFRAARGLCNAHLSQLQTMPGNALGISVLVNTVLDELLTLNPPQSRPLQRFFKPDYAADLQPTGPCLVCKQMNKIEASYLSVLQDNYGETLLEALRDSPGGLCLPHFRIAVRRLPDADGLIRVQQAHWRRIHDEIVDYIDRTNFKEGITPEQVDDDSWRRAIRYTAGEPGVFGLRRD